MRVLRAILEAVVVAAFVGAVIYGSVILEALARS